MERRRRRKITNWKRKKINLCGRNDRRNGGRGRGEGKNIKGEGEREKKQIDTSKRENGNNEKDNVNKRRKLPPEIFLDKIIIQPESPCSN